MSSGGLLSGESMHRFSLLLGLIAGSARWAEE
jgi:hypothetical protein